MKKLLYNRTPRESLQSKLFVIETSFPDKLFVLTTKENIDTRTGGFGHMLKEFSAGPNIILKKVLFWSVWVHSKEILQETHKNEKSWVPEQNLLA